MTDYTNSRSFGVKQYPVHATTTTPLFKRIEPIITSKQILSRYLKGVIDLDYSEEEMKDQINLAVNEIELLTNLPIYKTQRKERLPYDRNLYQSYVYIKTEAGPILSVERLAVESSSGQNVFNLPPEWLEMGLANKRQINVLPILTIFGASGLAQGSPSNAGLIFLQAVNNYTWLPAFFTIEYTVGLCSKDGHVPVIINDLIGIFVAIEILNNMQNRNIYSSESISQDGISQSSGSAGPQIYQTRITQLEQKKDQILKKIQSIFHQRMFLGRL